MMEGEHDERLSAVKSAVDYHGPVYHWGDGIKRVAGTGSHTSKPIAVKPVVRTENT